MHGDSPAEGSCGVSDIFTVLTECAVSKGTFITINNVGLFQQ